MWGKMHVQELWDCLLCFAGGRRRRKPIVLHFPIIFLQCTVIDQNDIIRHSFQLLPQSDWFFLQQPQMQPSQPHTFCLSLKAGRPQMQPSQPHRIRQYGHQPWRFESWGHPNVPTANPLSLVSFFPESLHERCDMVDVRWATLLLPVPATLQTLGRRLQNVMNCLTTFVHKHNSSTSTSFHLRRPHNDEFHLHMFL